MLEPGVVVVTVVCEGCPPELVHVVVVCFCGAPLLLVVVVCRSITAPWSQLVVVFSLVDDGELTTDDAGAGGVT